MSFTTLTQSPSTSTLPSSTSIPSSPISKNESAITLEEHEKPLNWTIRKKGLTLAILGSYTFLSAFGSTIMAPGLTKMAIFTFHFTSETTGAFLVSIYLLAYAIGPLLLAPLSELYGRRPILNGSLLFFTVFSIACALAKTTTQMAIFRFLSGLGGSAPLAIGYASGTEIYIPAQRRTSGAILALGPLLGPVLGPVVGGFVTYHVQDWRWLFWILSIVSGVVCLFGIPFLSETYEPAILAAKIRRMRTSSSESQVSVTNHLLHSFTTPLRLLFTSPIVFLLALYQAIIYGQLYLFFVIFPSTFEQTYRERIDIASLNYLAFGIGFIIGLVCLSIMIKEAWARAKRSLPANVDPEPEVWLICLLPAAIILPIGLFLFGWSAHNHWHWTLPALSSLLFAFSLLQIYMSSTLYIAQAFPPQTSASAQASLMLFRSLLGFASPLFGVKMFEGLGVGWGCSVLGFVAVCVGVPGSFGLWRWGKWLRQRGARREVGHVRMVTEKEGVIENVVELVMRGEQRV
ncbi:hypothetical protein YB2330_005143 [Saitoella coloradoensis]